MAAANVGSMTALIHLNGPPGIGKSTLSARYVDNHPGTLNLDVDTLHHLIGGWRESEGRFHDLLRPMARAMAATHLAGGRDVILPQYVGKVAELAAFERVAHEAGAVFVEIILITDRTNAVTRFDARPDDTDWARHNRELVRALGGDDFLGHMHDQLFELIAQRPDALIIESEPGAIDETYVAVLQAIAARLRDLTTDRRVQGAGPE